MSDEFLEETRKVKKVIDKISPTFCAAKWKQVTMHLESGLTHSCHHPQAHFVPTDELEEDVSALHNTKYKKRMRRAMLNGEVVPECEYCNKAERESPDTYSDRYYKSSEPWASKYIDEIVNSSPDNNVYPSYFEVSFSSMCNCSCMYCSPTFSTTWQKEIEKLGGYPTNISSRDFDDSPPPRFLDGQNNPFIEAFWEWWPDLYNHLEFFRITGGEPLLHKDTFKVLDYIIENPKPDLMLDINSNFCVNSHLFINFIEKYKRIAENHEYVGVFTSCEAHGEKAEYIRHGFDYQYWLENCRTYLTEIPIGKLVVMCTYNLLSISSFKMFLEDILEMKKEFPYRVVIDVPILLAPTYFQAKNISKDFLSCVEDAITFMYQNHDVPKWQPMAANGFWQFEIEKLIRAYNMIKYRPESIQQNVLARRKDFKAFVDEYDKRHGTDFLSVFPEYKNFYMSCEG